MRRADDRVVVHKTVVVVNLFLVLMLWVCVGSTPCPAVDEPGAMGLENASQALSMATSILDTRVEKADSFVRLDIVADGKIEKYNQFTISGPTRLVLDLSSLTSRLERDQHECDAVLVKRIRVGEHPDHIRVVLESPQTEFPPYKIVSHDQGLTVFIGTGFNNELAGLDTTDASFPVTLAPLVDKSTVAAADPGITNDEPSPVLSEETSVAVTNGSDDSHAPAIDTFSEPQVAWEDSKDISDTAQVSAMPSAAAGYVSEAGETGAVSPTTGNPGEITETATAPVARVEEASEHAGTAAESAQYTAPFPTAPQEAISGGERIAAAEPEQEVDAAVSQNPEPLPPVSETTRSPESEAGVTSTAQVAEPEVQPEEDPPRYVGERISLDFKDADINNILRLIAEVSDLNVVAGDDVKGTVTIKLTDVPWDQALEVILLSNGLGMDLQGNILRVAPLDKLNREKEKVLESKKKAEKLEPLKKGLVPVSYANVADLKKVVTSSKLLSPRGSIQFDKRTNTMVVIDIEKNIREINRLINELDTPTPQVLIEARIIQINPTYTKELGVSWDAAYTTTSDNSIIGVGGNEGVEIDGETGTVTANGSIVDLAPAVGPGAGGAISFGFLNNNFALFAKIAALEKDEKLEIISSPRIMTLDNQEAIIEQGVDLPYLKLSEEGVTSTEFKKATLALTVTPHITSDESVQMEVEVKKDQRSAQTGAGDEPGIDTRRAETNVLVRSGNTVVIGGIYEETKADSHNSVPFFGRLPLLGFLFKGTSEKRAKTELVVFITPTIVTIEKAPLEEAIWISEAEQVK
ncbi:MAG TPA: type IV pilus secretin PilQ [Thermodesulfobacteriota bacterium]|nr:type IV pilus secretin PilQ [Thermodesulfobacteriota bacterium]